MNLMCGRPLTNKHARCDRESTGPVLLPHSWQLFISKADHNSHCGVSLSDLLRYSWSFEWFESWVNMLLVFFCCALRRLCTELSRQRLVAAAAAGADWTQYIPTLLPSTHPLPTPFTLHHTLPRANSHAPGKHWTCLQHQLHYVRDSLNMRHLLK